MVGIDDMILFPLVGSAVGGLMKKDNPLQGALMGGALGFGGAALPGLLGGAGAASTAGATAGAGGYAEEMARLGAQAGAEGGGAGGLLGGLKTVGTYAKEANPIMQAGVLGSTVSRNMASQNKMPTPQMPMQQNTGAGVMSQLYQQGQQGYLTPLQQAQNERMQRRNMWG